MKGLWLSIKPEWITAILAGQKTVELRRRKPDVPAGSVAILYATSPQCRFVALAKVGAVAELPLNNLWRNYGARAAVTKGQFHGYFDGCERGTAITLSNMQPLKRPIELDTLRTAGFQPAQGWRYVSPESIDELLDLCARSDRSSSAGPVARGQRRSR